MSRSSVRTNFSNLTFSERAKMAAAQKKKCSSGINNWSNGQATPRKHSPLSGSTTSLLKNCKNLSKTLRKVVKNLKRFSNVLKLFLKARIFPLLRLGRRLLTLVVSFRLLRTAVLANMTLKSLRNTCLINLSKRSSLLISFRLRMFLLKRLLWRRKLKLSIRMKWVKSLNLLTSISFRLRTRNMWKTSTTATRNSSYSK